MQSHGSGPETTASTAKTTSGRVRRRRLSWFRFFPDDFAGGVASFSPEEVGQYVLLLLAQWASGARMSVSNDARLRRICRKKPSIHVIEKFDVLADGSLRNPRLAEEWESASAEYSGLSRGGGNSPSARLVHAQRTPSAPPSAPPSVRKPEPEPEPQPRTNNRKRNPPSLFEGVSSSAATSTDSQAHQEHLVTAEEADHVWRLWHRLTSKTGDPDLAPPMGKPTETHVRRRLRNWPKDVLALVVVLAARDSFDGGFYRDMGFQNVMTNRPLLGAGSAPVERQDHVAAIAERITRHQVMYSYELEALVAEGFESAVFHAKQLGWRIDA